MSDFAEKVAVQSTVTIVSAVAVGLFMALIGIPPEPATCIKIGTAIGGGGGG